MSWTEEEQNEDVMSWRVEWNRNKKKDVNELDSRMEQEQKERHDDLDKMLKVFPFLLY